jgi:redox-sensitive bicupin YhaK (pirin superfamily)
MFPLVEPDRPNPLELFQIWLNLPAADKLVDPHFTMLWRRDLPVVRAVDEAGRATEVTVVAGALGDAVPPPPPPRSYAAAADADLAVWHLRFEPGARWELPPAAGRGTARVLYVFAGESISVAGDHIPGDTGVVVRSDLPITVEAGPSAVEVLLLQGRPIGEPVASYGPFVMSTRAEIAQAFADYQDTGFGGWPWPDDAPTHGRDRGRFARHADGRVIEAGPR